MKKNSILKEFYIILSLILLILVGFVIYRLGSWPTIHFYSWHGLNKVENPGDMIALEDYELSSNLMIISSEHPVDESFLPPIVEYRETGVYMSEDITEEYGKLSDYIRTNMNNTLYIESSYRSYEDQARVLEEEGAEIAAQPGCSEHQSGLALDVYVMYFGGSAFTNSYVGKFVNTNCGDFGFIIRYPAGKENITGFGYEPWHIRYVGLPHSKIISEGGITLEEYVESFDIDSWYIYENYLISRQNPDNLSIPAKYKSNDIKVSPDNTGYYIITINTDK